MRQTHLPDGTPLPVLGLGTRRLGQDRSRRQEEIRSVQAAIARPRGLTAAQIALAWITARPGVLAIPKAVSLQHLRENLAASRIELDAAELQAIDDRFPRPRSKTPQAMV